MRIRKKLAERFIERQVDYSQFNNDGLDKGDYRALLLNEVQNLNKCELWEMFLSEVRQA